MKFKIACGTDDKKKFTNNHFGDSKYFLIYEYDSKNKNIKFIKKINNNSKDEKGHGDIKKANNISSILQDVSVLIAFTMGPNIIKIKKKFIPIISQEKNITKALKKIKKIIPEIIKETKLLAKKDKKIFTIN